LPTRRGVGIKQIAIATAEDPALPKQLVAHLAILTQSPQLRNTFHALVAYRTPVYPIERRPRRRMALLGLKINQIHRLFLFRHPLFQHYQPFIVAHRGMFWR
jgi:hypothetical protein